MIRPTLDDTAAPTNRRRARWAVGALVALTTACGASTPTEPVVAPSPKAERPKPLPDPLEIGAPRLCLGAQSLATLVAQGPLPPADPTLKESLRLASTTGAKADPMFSKAYRDAAPATVFIQTHRGGYGTGVVVSDKGWALTNYHVVQSGKQDDFSIKVKVFFGELTKTGRMVKTPKAYEGVVVRADPVRDIALVKIVNPPKKLAIAPLAKKDPKAGQPIAAIGHAGIGLLWAMKTCSVSAVGERQHRAKYQFDCDHLEDPAADSAVNDARQKRCEERQKDAIEQINELQQGLVLQTDCSIAKGDSGGPVINGKGEIVALNQSMTSDSRTSSNVAYHVHVAELREFVSKATDVPAFMPPDPWCEGGLETQVSDVDLDGKIDTAKASGRFRYAVFYDLDQDSYIDGKPKATGAGHMPFDAEVAILSLPMGTYSWYDRDNDGQFDMVLVDARDSGSVKRAYALSADGSFEELEDATGGEYLDAAHLKDAAMKGRLGRLAKITQPRFASSETLAGAAADSVPDPLWGGGRKGELRDMDRDGTPDLLRLESPYSTGWLIDADQGTFTGLGVDDDPQQLINDRKVDAEISVISQSRNFWALYDRDDDGTFDLALRAPAGNGHLATQAWHRKGKSWAPSGDGAGLRALRPDLLGDARARKVVRSTWTANIYAANEGLGLVPEPRPKQGYYTSLSADGVADKTLIKVYTGSGTSLLVDVNHDAKLKGKGLRQAVASRAFTPEVMTHTVGQSVWVYYDGDADGTVDVVLFGANAKKGQAAAGYRLSGGKLAFDEQLANGPLYRRSLFATDELKRSFDVIAEAVFKSEAVE